MIHVTVKARFESREAEIKALRQLGQAAKYYDGSENTLGKKDQVLHQVSNSYPSSREFPYVFPSESGAGAFVSVALNVVPDYELDHLEVTRN